MITARKTTVSPIVELEIDGAISEEEFDAALATLREAIDEHGTIRILKHVKSLAFPPIPLSRLWDDGKFAFEHLGHISQIAGVADIPQLKNFVRLLDPMFKPELRFFPCAELEQARRWLQSAGSEGEVNDASLEAVSA